MRFIADANPWLATPGFEPVAAVALPCRATGGDDLEDEDEGLEQEEILPVEDDFDEDDFDDDFDDDFEEELDENEDTDLKPGDIGLDDDEDDDGVLPDESEFADEE